MGIGIPQCIPPRLTIITATVELTAKKEVHNLCTCVLRPVLSDRHAQELNFTLLIHHLLQSRLSLGTSKKLGARPDLRTTEAEGRSPA